MKKWLYILSAFVVFASCKKEELQPNIDDTPEFFVNGEIDDKELKLVAGDNDYYMFSSHSTNDNNVQQFIGELKTENCETGCPESLEIIYTNEQGPAEQIARLYHELHRSRTGLISALIL